MTGTYLVEAKTAEEAKAQFGGPGIAWDKVEQIDYMAFSCRVEGVAEGATE